MKALSTVVVAVAACTACSDATPAPKAFTTTADSATGDLATSTDTAQAETVAEIVGQKDAAAADVVVDVAADAAPPKADVAAADVHKKPEYTFVSAACSATPTAGAVLAATPKAYSGGKCPLLVADGQTENTLQSKGNARQFKLIVPKDLQPGEHLSVLFAWHWLKGSANSFVDTGQLVSAVAQQRFIAVIPESKNDIEIPIPFVKNKVSFPWPIVNLSPQARFDEEFAFFDDMLACVNEQYAVNKECVAMVGVSAGALFGAQLALARSEHISSFLSLSGGTQSDGISNLALLPYKSMPHKMPMLVLWGGPSDSCVLVNFAAASVALEKGLDQDGHFVVECVHNCQHGVPPVEAAAGVSQFKALWDFAWAHPFWLPAGSSPWAKGLPADAPPWCAVGSGNAKIRTGPCGSPSCPL